MRRTDFLILIACGILVVLGFIVVTSWLNQAVGFQAVEEFPQLAQAVPEQDNEDVMALPVLTFGKSIVRFETKAGYSIYGQLAAKKRYHKGLMSNVSPYDYALIWGDLPKMQDKIKFRQVVRYCLFNYEYGSGVDPAYVQLHMSNNHLIPATKNLRRALAKARKGDLIKIEGYLVDVVAYQDGRNISHWRTSTEREDIGEGACEIIYVTSLRINDTIYQ